MHINNKSVNTLINRYGYNAYMVKLNKSMRCECLNPSTKEPNKECRHCLGTGYYIKISTVFMATREGKAYEADRAQSFAVNPKIVYLKGFVNANKDDIIVDSENVYSVYTVQHHRGSKGEQMITRCVCPDLKLNKVQFLKLFKELLNEHLQNSKRNK